VSVVATRRHVPERTCVGCRTTRPKAALLRLVLPEDAAVAVDRTGRHAGRGAYLCADHPLDCLGAARKRRALTRAFRTTPERVDVDALTAELTGAASQQEE
jgi:predicted RNA-binding protein YlxR (DUF448 family)